MTSFKDYSTYLHSGVFWCSVGDKKLLHPGAGKAIRMNGDERGLLPARCQRAVTLLLLGDRGDQ